MALIANYAMHGTVLGGANLEISGDAPGVVSEYVESKTGVPLLYINGQRGKHRALIYSVYPSAAVPGICSVQCAAGRQDPRRE